MKSYILFTLMLTILIDKSHSNHYAKLKKHKNVLFVISDDMRPQLNSFLKDEFSPITKFPRMHTPNLKRLRKKSITFKRTYCQYPMCGPSRTSFLTGRRPDTTKVTDLFTYFRNVGGNFTTIPQFFKEKGFNTYGYGKIFHQGLAASNDNDPISWTKRQEFIVDNWWKQEIIWKSLSKEDLSDNPLHDEIVTHESLKKLDELGHLYRTKNENFFLAVGYRKPHLPFTIPEEFFKYYPRVSVPNNPFFPGNMPEKFLYDNFEFHNRDDTFPQTPNQTLPSRDTIEIRRAYYAVISFIDNQVGQILRSLKKNKLTKDTIVVFFGDHGFHLGENGSWGKLQSFEIDTRVPFMMHIPRLTNKGVTTEKLVELLDIFPTLVEAAGFPPLEKCPKYSANVKLCTEGKSLMPLVRHPETRYWTEAAFSQSYFPRHVTTKDYEYVAYNVHTGRYRYTEWYPFNGTTLNVNWTKREAVELYDHLVDPGETYNIPVEKVDHHTIKQLHGMLINLNKERNF